MRFTGWWKSLPLVAMLVLMSAGCARSIQTGAAQGGQAAAAPDFKDKTVRIIVGFAAGGGYDTYARVIAPHLGRHLPGQPTVIVENMTGGGSLVAANSLAKNQKPDGLAVGLFNSNLVLQAALGAQGAQFKGDEFGWIGTPVTGTPACAFMASAGVSSWQDIVSSGKELRLGATSVGSTTGDMPRILDKVTKAKFRMVEGYDGTSEIRRALQAGEVDGACWGWESMSVTGRAMLDAEGPAKMIPVLIEGTVTEAPYNTVPKPSAIITDPEALAMYKAWLAPYQFERPFALPPNTPANIVKAYRDAWNATMADEAFLADARQAKLEIRSVTGEATEKLVKELLAMPASAKQSLSFLVTGS